MRIQNEDMTKRLFYLAFASILLASCGTGRKAALQTKPSVQIVSDTLSSKPQSSEEDSYIPLAASARHNFSIVTPYASDTWQGIMQQSLDRLVNEPLFETTQLGLCVYDITDDRMLYSLNARHRMRPASCEKIVTTVVALDVLGGNFRYVPSVEKPGSGWCWDDKITQQMPFTLGEEWTMDQALLPIMKNSDNKMAESLFACIKKSDINNVIKKVGLNPADYRIEDGSGLSLYNYVSPLLLVRLLTYAWVNEQIRTHFYPSLPVSGVDGTLSKRMKGSNAFSRIHAKTGTVEGVSSLAGYAMTQNGHVLAFSIINQGVQRTLQGKDFQDKVCLVLTNN